MDSNKKIDVYAGIFLLVFAIILFISTLSFQQMTVAKIGSAFFPQIASIGMGLLSFFLIISPFIQTRLNKKSKQKDSAVSTDQYTDAQELQEEGEKSSEKKFYGLVLATLLLLITYVLLMKPLGFIIASSLYLFVQMYIMSRKENRNYIIFAVVSIFSSVLVYWAFKGFFNLMLPAGLLG